MLLRAGPRPGAPAVRRRSEKGECEQQADRDRLVMRGAGGCLEQLTKISKRNERYSTKKETCDLFNGLFGHLYLEYPVDIENVLSHDGFTEKQIEKAI